jgi:propionate CoA-transferase
MSLRPAFLAPQDAAELIESGDTILIGGSGGGLGTPERMLQAIAARYARSRAPSGLTAVHPVGCGDWGRQGMSRLAEPGLLKRQVTGSLGNSPATMAMAAQDEIEAYTLPQGVLAQLCREIAAGRPGLLTHVGLGSFVDPRHGGGRQSRRAREDLVELMQVRGRDYLFYPSFHVDVALIRATTADERGNLTMEHEPFIGDALAMAQAARNCGGLVIAQVERIRCSRTVSAREVKIPGILVDVVVVDPDQQQTYRVRYDPGYSGELRIPLPERPEAQLDDRAVIVRRAALELFPGAVVNLGYGISSELADLVWREGIADDVTLTVEQGVIGGIPVSGNDFGAAVNYDALIEQAAQFDFYDGGGLDLAFLSFAEVDGGGNVNVSRFAGRPNGAGGFIHIAQNARAVCFLGTLTAGGFEAEIVDGTVRILCEGRQKRFVDRLAQCTFSRSRGRDGQRVRFITERAVLDADRDGLVVSEVAPGIQLADVLACFAVPPRISPDLVSMSPEIFQPRRLDLQGTFASKAGSRHHPRLRKLLLDEG